MTVQPEGTVTFMFTDIEGSTRLLLQVGEGYISVLEKQRRLMRDIFATYNGHEEGTEGDSFFVSFSRAIDAVSAASEIQRTLANTEWPDEQEVKVRIGLHTGEPWFARDRFVGIDIHLAQRISAVGYGGQILLSETTTALIRDKLPEGTTLIDLGRHRLKDIAQPERISQLVIQGLPSDYPPLRSAEAVDAQGPGIPHNLPIQSTPFVGREEELAKLDRLLADSETRLVTVVGPGGMGKTRLALAAAELQVQSQHDRPGSFRFPDGVYFIALEDSTTEEQLFLEVLHAFELPTGRGMAPRDQLHNYLKEKHLLLLLDNFDQLLVATGAITDILSAAQGVKLLVTSRERLALHVEQLLPVQGMAYPETITVMQDELDSYSAPRLFIQSARRILPEFGLDLEDKEELAAICRLVGGMPLALELAAGWVDTLSLGEIVSEIQTGLDFLESDFRDIPERHRSISAVIESTWTRLGPNEQRLFSQLSVFRGGFNRQAAEAITGASFRQLAVLVNRSLLQYDRAVHRYQIHPLLREFAKGTLANNQEILKELRDRHSRYFCVFIGQRQTRILNNDSNSFLKAMDLEVGNLLLAWEWTIERRLVNQIDLAFDGLVSFLLQSGRVKEAPGKCQEAAHLLARSQDPNEQKILGKILVTWGGMLPGDNVDLEYVRRGLALLDSAAEQGVDSREEKAYALRRMGDLTSRTGRMKAADKFFEESLQTFEQLDNQSGVAEILWTISGRKVYQGQFNAAEKDLIKSTRLFDRVGNQNGKYRSLLRLAKVYCAQGKFDKALDIGRSIAVILKDDNSLLSHWYLPWSLGFSYFYSGSYQEAQQSFHAAAQLSHAAGAIVVGNHVRLFEVLTATFQGKYLHLTRSSDNNLDHVAYHMVPYQELLSALNRMVEDQLSSALEPLNNCLTNYHARGNRSEIGLPLAWHTIALRGLGRRDEAAAQLHEALAMAVETGCIYPVMHGLPAAALLLADLGQKERAIEVYETALQFPHVANAQLFEDVVGKEIKAAAAELPPEVVAEAKERGRAADPWALTTELAEEFASKG